MADHAPAGGDHEGEDDVDGNRLDATFLSETGERLDYFDPARGISAMMRTTGFSLAITGAMQAAGKVKPGVWTPDEAMPGREYIAALAERGVVIQESRVVLGR